MVRTELPASCVRLERRGSGSKSKKRPRFTEAEAHLDPCGTCHTESDPQAARSPSLLAPEPEASAVAPDGSLGRKRPRENAAEPVKSRHPCHAVVTDGEALSNRVPTSSAAGGQKKRKGGRDGNRRQTPPAAFPCGPGQAGDAPAETRASTGRSGDGGCEGLLSDMDKVSRQGQS